MKREEALEFIKERVDEENIVKHMLATEAVMRGLARKLEPEKEEEWGLVGLFHDGDYSSEVPVEKQGILVSEWLNEVGYEICDNIKRAMAAHNAENTGVEPESKMDWGLFCCDSLTGLIIATALVRPDKKLAEVKVKSVRKKFKQPSFAAGTRREDIKMCEEKLGLSLDEFIAISLDAIQGISDELGL